jgi:hypothetical protein
LRYAKLIVLACGCSAIALAAAFPAFSDQAQAQAKDPPYRGCVEVAKQEYDAARKQKLLQTRFNRYVRTGRIGRRHYWYCQS